MTTSIDRLAADINPEKTVLLFGAGASISSGAPSVQTLKDNLTKTFGINGAEYSLTELCGIIEEKYSRKQLITDLRNSFKSLHPTGGLLDLPRYNWRSIFQQITTNWSKIVMINPV